MSETTAYEALLEEGEIKNSHKTLLRLGRQRFQQADAATEAAIRSITDLDRLERMIDAMLTAKSWQELLATG